MKNNLSEYFTDKEIIRVLCKKRIKASKVAHDLHFLRNISGKAKSPHTLSKKGIYTFFPPRNLWIRLRKNEWKIRTENHEDILLMELERTIRREIKKCKLQGLEHPTWLNNLLTFTEGVRKSVFDESVNYELPKPKIIPVLKSGNIYRPLSRFELVDNIIICQISKYLSNCFDPLFSDSSYAFRTGIQKEKIFNHHKAVEDIIEFKKVIGKPLYVAECDIKKFFDCVNHHVITEEFKSISQTAKEKLNLEIDKRAIDLFHSYLNAYSFKENIKKEENELFRRNKISNGIIPWVEESELLEVNSDPATERIGIPQGGAISCLIANLMLNKIDKVINDNSDENTFYGRFCDDMIVMHTSKARCEALFVMYQTSLKELKLISHKPQTFTKYGKDFWDERLKSKLPYKWDINDKANAENERNVPWLSFVGYQIRYDGRIRVRKKSIEKELKKQVEETDKVIDAVWRAVIPYRSRRSIKFRLQQRLIAMSVGREKSGLPSGSMCWTAGFKVLKKNPFMLNQIKNLDRNRERQIKRLEKFLVKIKTPIGESGFKPLKYYGFKYSYFKQFANQ
jgi:hypothetical protein